MFRNVGLVVRSLTLCLALGSLFACAAEDTSKEDEGSTSSDLSKGKGKHPGADASIDGSASGGEDGGLEDAAPPTGDGGYLEDASVDGGYLEDASVGETDGGFVEDAGTAW